jgi:dihydroxyacetone kinase-like predicted kinase
MPEVARAIAYGSLLGARGNSGVILSQILKGFSEAIRKKEALDAETLKEALRLGAETGYRAVMRPVEGTILTVARAAGEGARGDSLKDVLESALAAAREALAKTPELLPVLKQAGVVDAGGAGYVRFLEGIHGYALGLPLPEPPKVERYAQTAFATEEFGYCTEFLMEGVEVPIEKIREAVAPFGDSLLVVGAEGYVKGHVHTDDPDGLLSPPWPALAAWCAPRWRTCPSSTRRSWPWRAFWRRPRPPRAWWPWPWGTGWPGPSAPWGPGWWPGADPEPQRGGHPLRHQKPPQPQGDPPAQ